jgi:hypothetical protein
MSQEPIIIHSSDKFNTCRHRSPEEITKTIKRCSCQGGDIEAKGFFCFKKNLFKINEQYCNVCEMYESK